MKRSWTIAASYSGVLLLGILLGAMLAPVDATAASLTRTSSFEYDAATGLLTKEVIEPGDANLCLVTAYNYDAFGNKTSATTRNCNGSAGEAPTPSGNAAFGARTSANGYDAQGRFAATSTNALNQSETKAFDPRFGSVTSLTGPNALTTTWALDGFGRKILETRADGTNTKYEYLLCSGVGGGTAACPSGAKYLIQTTPLASNGTTQNGPWSKTYYDVLNREIRTEIQGYDGSGTAQVIVKDTQYDSLARVSRVSRPYYSGATVYWTGYAYDVLGRPTGETQADGSQSTYSYNGLNTVATNALNQGQTKTKNSQGQLVSVKDAQNNTITYQYDPFGNLTKTIDPLGNAITLSYDLRGRKAGMVDPDMGAWSYEYNALGELVRQTDAKNQTSTLAYDLLGRMTNRSEADLISNWYYDNYKGGTTCSKGIGKLCEAESDNGYNRQHTYDSLGRPSTTATRIDAAYTDSRSYDAQGRIATRTWPTGFAVKYVYTALGYLKEIRNNASNALYWQANAMDAEDHLLQQTYGNNIITQQIFDAPTGRLKNAYAGAGNAVQNLTIQYDALGNVTNRQDANQNLTESFLYDSLNRLTSATVNSPATGIITTAYAYDAIGNLTCKSDISACSAANPNYTYQATAPLAGGGSRALAHAVSWVSGGPGGTGGAYQYDGNGNVTLFGNAYTAAYTSYNLVKTVSTSAIAEFQYGPDRQRIHQKANWNGIRDVYYLHPDNQNGLFYEKAVTVTLQIATEHTHYLTAAGQVVAVVVQNDSGSAVRYLHRDHLGSLTATSDESGAVLERYAYEPYGKRRFPNGASDPGTTIYPQYTYRGFTNHEHLSEVGLIHMNGRIYHPGIGRFMSPDSYLQAPANLQSYNRYAYVMNNPLFYTDPSGYSWWTKFRDHVVKPVVAIAAMVYAPEISGYLWGSTNAIVAGATGGFIAGGVQGGTLQSAITGGISGAAFGGLHGWDVTNAGFLESAAKVGAHGMVGGVMSEMQGGNFGSGFMAAAFTQSASQMGAFNNLGDPRTASGRFQNAMAAAAVGGTASVIGGGKFSNGAMTGAFSRLFNDIAFSVDKNAAGGNGHTTLFFQDGKDQWYSYNQGAAGQTSSGEGNIGYMLGLDAPAGVSIARVDSIPKGSYVMHTTSAQDVLITDSAGRSAQAHNSGQLKYNLYSNNCTDASVGVVNNAGAGINVQNSAFTVRPNSWFRELPIR